MIKIYSFLYIFRQHFDIHNNFIKSSGKFWRKKLELNDIVVPKRDKFGLIIENE